MVPADQEWYFLPVVEIKNSPGFKWEGLMVDQDPSICRAGNDYYLVNSSMGYFPGIPISYSKGLVNWEQIGYVLTTKEQLPLGNSAGFGGISGGIMAPTIRYHKGTFYVISTNLAVFKNFIVGYEKIQPAFYSVPGSLAGKFSWKNPD